MIYTQDTGLNTFYTGRHLIDAAGEYYQEQKQYEESNIVDRASTLGIIQSSRYALDRIWGRPTGKFLSRETFVPKSLSTASILKGGATLPAKLALGYMLFGYDDTSDIVANAALVGGMNWVGKAIGNSVDRFKYTAVMNKTYKDELSLRRRELNGIWSEASKEARNIGSMVGNKDTAAFRRSRREIFREAVAAKGYTSMTKTPSASMLHNFLYKSEMMKGKFGTAMRDIIESYKPLHEAESAIAAKFVYKKSFKRSNIPRRMNERGMLHYRGEWQNRSRIAKDIKKGTPRYIVQENIFTINGPLDVAGKIRRTSSREVTAFTANTKWKREYIESKLLDATGFGEKAAVIERAARSSDAALGIRYIGSGAIKKTSQSIKVLGKVAGSTAIIAGVGTYLASPYIKKGFDTFDTGLTKLQNSFSLDFGDGYSPLSGEATNERTRALDRMKNANLNARSSMGSEASFYGR